MNILNSILNAKTNEQKSALNKTLNRKLGDFNSVKVNWPFTDHNHVELLVDYNGLEYEVAIKNCLGETLIRTIGERKGDLISRAVQSIFNEISGRTS